MAPRMDRTRSYYIAPGEAYRSPAVTVSYTEGTTSVAISQHRRLSSSAEIEELMLALEEVRLHVAAAERGEEPES